MPLKDLLKKRDRIREDVAAPQDPAPTPSPTEFTFMRSDTNTQELIQPPTFAEDDASRIPVQDHHTSKLVSRFRSSSNASTSSKASSRGEKRLSQRLHLRSASRTSSTSSVVPTDLPAIEDTADGNEEKEARWEERATILAQGNHAVNQASAATEEKGGLHSRGNSIARPHVTRNISDAKGDVSAGQASMGHGRLM